MYSQTQLEADGLVLARMFSAAEASKTSEDEKRLTCAWLERKYRATGQLDELFEQFIENYDKLHPGRDISRMRHLLMNVFGGK